MTNVLGPSLMCLNRMVLARAGAVGTGENQGRRGVLGASPRSPRESVKGALLVVNDDVSFWV